MFMQIELTWKSRATCRYRIERAATPAGPWLDETGEIEPDSGDTTSAGFEWYGPDSRLFIRVTAFRPQ
jgi:hypothetical protein